MECLLISALHNVFHLVYQVFDGISICNTCKNDGLYNISYRNMWHSEQKLAYSCLCCIDHTPDSYLIQLWIFIHHELVFTHSTTIQKKLLCVSQFPFQCVHFSIHYITDSLIVMQQNIQPSRHQHAPRPCNFVSKMFLTPKSTKNLNIPIPTKIHTWNSAKATIIITQIVQNFGVMEPSKWMICQGSNSQ